MYKGVGWFNMYNEELDFKQLTKKEALFYLQSF